MQPLIERAVEEFEQGRITRRELVTRLSSLSIAAGLGLGRFALGEEKPSSAFAATGIDHVALTVTDIPRSRAFYERVLGMKTTSCSEYSCFLDCGRDFLALFKGPKAGLNHMSFSIPNYEPARAVKTLTEAGLEPEREANRVYFEDPDGLTLQVSSE